MTFCSALFIILLGDLRGEMRGLAHGDVLAAVSFTLPNPRVLEAIGIDAASLGLGASGASG